uniref:Waglerin family protein n=1 Tax=Siphoviridae sp. ct3o911 TaxID=2827560 RepID=A0A8S5LJF2_9CAUD|nr:MAG TPA: waglerin family protein [Siphoviridae sp. ct3o911]
MHYIPRPIPCAARIHAQPGTRKESFSAAHKGQHGQP